MTEWADTLWAEASLDHEAIAREAAADRAAAEIEQVMPFFLASRSPSEYAHRRAMAGERIASLALHAGLDPDQLMALADRQVELYFEAISRMALPEGADPLDAVVRATRPQGAGPEKPDEHDEEADFSHGYSEVPAGNLQGPAPQVVTPQFGRPQAPEEVTAMRRQAQASLRRQADASLPAGVSDAGITPDGTGQGGAMASPAPAPAAPAGAGPSGMNVSSGDPYNIQVTSVARSIMGTNPQLAEGEARRIARRVVGSYLRQGDLNSSVISDDYGSGGASAPRDSSGGGGFMQHMLEGQGLRSMLPGGAATEGAAAGGAAGDLAELAPLAL